MDEMVGRHVLAMARRVNFILGDVCVLERVTARSEMWMMGKEGRTKESRCNWGIVVYREG